MPHIDTTWFGAVVVDKKTYKDILIIGDEVVRRESQKSYSSHSINEWELTMLLEGTAGSYCHRKRARGSARGTESYREKAAFFF
jgi:hypothetical protein